MRSTLIPDRQLIITQAEVVRAFNSATARPPWSRLPEEERINYLRQLVRPLINLATTDTQNAHLCRRGLLIAARHGQRRHEQGFSEEILLQDFDVFGRAILALLAERDVKALEGSAYA